MSGSILDYAIDWKISEDKREKLCCSSIITSSTGNFSKVGYLSVISNMCLNTYAILLLID